MPLKLVFRADRELQRVGVLGQAIENGLNILVKIRARAVELVDETNARHFVVVGIVPVGLGLRLNAGDPVKDDGRAVQHAHRALHLDGEIDVPRGVDEIQAMRLSKNKWWRRR